MFSSAAPAGSAGSGAAVDGVLAGLSWLCQARVAEMPAAELADCLRSLERAESLLTAARSGVLAAFIAQDGCADDGHGSARTWLTWQAKVTKGAAAGAVGWVRRLSAHPQIAEALAAGQISASWARQLCDWTELLPTDCRNDGDAILLGAATGGADLAGLATLAEEMHRRTVAADSDEDRAFRDRDVRLDQTLGGAGRLWGDLTPQCAAALRAVFDALGSKAGPEDDRSKGQRHHDALAEACRRLIGSQCLPDRAGQPTQIRLHLTLDQLRGLPGAQDAEAAWAEAARVAAAAASGLVPSGPGDACDADIAAQVDGHVDQHALAQLTRAWQRACHQASWNRDEAADVWGGASGPAGTSGAGATSTPGATSGPGATSTPGATIGSGRGSELGADPRISQGADRTSGLGRASELAQRSMLRLAADAMSGPAGLAAYLRTGLLTGPAAGRSLPLDLGTPTPVIPAHLRRAVASRDTRCAFPGCDTPPAACQVHHLVPRAEGGTTALPNLMLLCSFHHLIAVHRWGWQLTLHPDGTTTARSPDGSRVLHSHGPPPATAA